MKIEKESIERRSGVDGKVFHAEYLGKNRPLILTDQVTRWPASRLWSDTYLIENFGERPIISYRHDDGIQTGHGLVEEPTTLGIMLEESRSRPKLRSLVLHVLRFAPWLIPDFAIPDVVSAAEVESSGFWIKPKGTTSGLHFDHQNGLLGVVRGRKRLWMFHPEEVANVYPCVIEDIGGRKRNWSDVRNVFEADEAKFPRLAQSTCHEVILEAGEMLFIPQYWWHAVDNQGDPTLSLNFFLDTQGEGPWPTFFHDRSLIERLIAALAKR